jgi:bifunctional non-homologous end joining protein LigD
MHPTLYPAPFTAAGWVFENKLDGFRALARKSGDKAELISRRGRLLARAFPEVIQAIATLPHDAVLDAELVVSDKRRHPAWDRLRRRSVMSRALCGSMRQRACSPRCCVSSICYQSTVRICDRCRCWNESGA